MICRPRLKPALAPGFTLMEMMIASFLSTLVVVGALSLYSRSNKTAADQQQFTQIQQDVRAAMHSITRDVRMAGMALREEFRMAALEGWDNQDLGGEVRPDRIRIMGNVDLPFAEPIVSLNGSGLKVYLNDYALTKYPYPESTYAGMIVLFLPGPSSTCVDTPLREITDVEQLADGSSVWINFTHGRALTINPPGGLNAMCPDADYIGGTVMFVDVREYWLDVTGHAPGLTAGVNGYIGDGVGGVLYEMYNGVHSPLAQNIENLQFQYNGDLNGDGALDGFADWNSSWTATQRSKIREVNIWVLGRTPDRFASIPALASRNTSLYRRPQVANSAAAGTDDWHRRYLLDSTVNIRNLSLDIYNKDQR